MQCSKNPDADIEEFWLYFKQSMINFYEKNVNFDRPINYWSDILNKFPKSLSFGKIELPISGQVLYILPASIPETKAPMMI